MQIISNRAQWLERVRGWRDFCHGKDLSLYKCFQEGTHGEGVGGDAEAGRDG